MPTSRETDPYYLQRFIEAQEASYEQARRELRTGCKRGHWIWFIFPQIRGLGHSAMAARYAIESIEEARAYLQHRQLGPRLRACTELVIQVEGRSLREILGSPDDLKFRSSMTLFAHAATENELFLKALRKYGDGEFDPLTLARL